MPTVEAKERTPAPTTSDARSTPETVAPSGAQYPASLNQEGALPPRYLEFPNRDGIGTTRVPVSSAGAVS